MTAFEVFEHLPAPLETIEKMLALSKNILFSTELLPQLQPRPGEWWYYAHDTGQHVSIYTRKSLDHIARHFGLNLCSQGSLHLLSEHPINSRAFSFVVRNRMPRLIEFTLRKRHPKRSLIPEDYERISGRPLGIG